jgi:hypothetical protein
MPIVKKEQEKEYLELIRKVLVYYPNAGALTIQRVLEKQVSADRPAGLHLDHRYIAKLADKIRREREKRITKGIKRRIAELQDHYNLMTEEVRTIAADPMMEGKDKASKIIKLFEADVALLETEMNAGIFTRKIGEIEVKNKADILRVILENVDEPTRQQFIESAKKFLGAGVEGGAVSK